MSVFIINECNAAFNTTRLQKYLLAGGVDNVEVFMKVQWKQLKGARYHHGYNN